MTYFSDSLLMIPRELPSYLKVAYSLRYAEKSNDGNCLARVCRVAQRTFALIKELICCQSTENSLKSNRKKLETDFIKINENIENPTKPICVYFVSYFDHNGAILGDQLYYYHHYKIRELQKHFAVAPKVVCSQNEMKEFIKSIREKYPDKEVRFVDVVSHGNEKSLDIIGLSVEDMDDDLFSDCAPNATILLDACNTGLGDDNIADRIAQKTRGRKILAPAPTMFFSKPIVQIKDKIPNVVSAVHGFAIFKAYLCKSFSRPSPSDENLSKTSRTLLNYHNHLQTLDYMRKNKELPVKKYLTVKKDENGDEFLSLERLSFWGRFVEKITGNRRLRDVARFVSSNYCKDVVENYQYKNDLIKDLELLKDKINYNKKHTSFLWRKIDISKLGGIAQTA